MLQLVRENKFNDPVIVTGTTRSGKSMLGPIVSSLKGSDKFHMDFGIEQYPFLHHLGLISDEVACYLTRFAYENLVYNNHIGRNSNFRIDDISSIWNSENPIEFYKRLTKKDGDDPVEEIIKKKYTFVLNIHNGLMNANFLFKAFPKLRMVHIKRNPIDIVHSWYLKGYGAGFWTNPRNSTPTINWKNNIIPYFANGWEDKYIRLPEMDRIIQMISILHKNHHETYNNLNIKQKKHIKVIKFEKFYC